MATLMMSVLAMAEPVRDAQVTTGANETYTQGAAENVTLYGGNVSSVNVSQTFASTRWVGLIGQVTHQLLLGTASNTFYDWGTFDSVGTVLVANESSFAVGSIAATTNTEAAAENTHLSLGTANDNVTNTLNGTNSNTYALGAVTINPGTSRALNTTGTASLWETTLLVSGTTAIYAGQIDQETNDFAGRPVDYQIMVPVDNTTVQRAYHFFAALG